MAIKKEIPKAMFPNYIEYVDSKINDGELFKLIRNIEIDTTDQTGLEFSNWDELYMFLRDHGDQLKDAK